MAWTTPLTAVENTAWTSAQWNTHVRDNLLETAPAKATAAGRYFVTSATNSIVERGPAATAQVLTSQTRTLTSYGDMATVGPSVTVTTGARALVLYSAHFFNSGGSAYASYAVSGATTIAAADNRAIYHNETLTLSLSSAHWETGLNAGSNTFTLKYRVSGGTGTYNNRSITVIPF